MHSKGPRMRGGEGLSPVRSSGDAVDVDDAAGSRRTGGFSLGSCQETATMMGDAVQRTHRGQADLPLGRGQQAKGRV